MNTISPKRVHTTTIGRLLPLRLLRLSLHGKVPCLALLHSGIIFRVASGKGYRISCSCDRRFAKEICSCNGGQLCGNLVFQHCKRLSRSGTLWSPNICEDLAAMTSTIVVAFLAWSMICGTLVQAAKKDFDFFYFVQQWPGSYCDTRKGCCFPISSTPKAVFGIHGLWPDYNDGSWPQFCDKEPFNPKEMSDVIDKMDDDWGSLACPSSDSHSFWKHEWTKHGTCSGLGQHGYFQAAIDLYIKYDITGALANAGIVPDGKHYEIEAVRKAISTVLDGHLPGVDCNKDSKGNRQIYQVWTCVAKDGSTLIDCPIFPRSECKGSVEFPVFDPSEAHHHHLLISNDVIATPMKSSI